MGATPPSEDRRAYDRWLASQFYAPRTRESYVMYATRAAKHLGGWRFLRQAEHQHLLDWTATLPPSAPSRNQARKALTSYFQFVSELTGRPRNPAADLLPTVPRRQGLPRPLSEEAHARFLVTAARLGGIYEVVGFTLATTACRFSELRSARWVQFDLAGRSWRIEGKGSKQAGPKQRQIDLHPRLVPVLRGWQSTSADYLFPARSPLSRHPYVSDHCLRDTFNGIADAAGLEGIVPHQLRHTVATLVLDRSKDITAVQELLGHSQLSTTQIYTKVLPGRMRAAVEALPMPGE